jgi:hypothetical protein
MENLMNRPIACVLAWSTLALAASLPAYAQNFPDRPVHLIIPYGPGGITDFAGRVLAQKIGEALGQTVVAENKPGAGGIVGVDYVAHSAPDGYNMAVMDPAVVVNPILQKSMPYDIFKDIVPLSITRSRRSSASRPMPNWSLTPKPIQASSIMPAPASAPRRISPPNCGRRAPASMPCTCLIRASARPIPT